jgi:hypothetical protein
VRIAEAACTLSGRTVPIEDWVVSIRGDIREASTSGRCDGADQPAPPEADGAADQLRSNVADRTS